MEGNGLVRRAGLRAQMRKEPSACRGNPMEWSEWVETNVDLANRNAAELRAIWLETGRVLV